MVDAEQRYDIKGITIVCVDGDADGDASNGVQQAFNLVLPKNTPITGASKVRQLPHPVHRLWADTSSGKLSCHARFRALRLIHRAPCLALSCTAQAAKLAKKGAKADKKAAKKAKKGKGGDEAAEEAEPEAEPAEEGEPPEGGAAGGDDEDDGGDVASVEINPASDDNTGEQQYQFITKLLAAGAKIEGGPDASTTPGAYTMKVLQDVARDNLEYTLDANNCLKDFKGTLLKAKGITVGLKLASINDTEVLGWPSWMIDFKVADEETQWPMTAGFKACGSTIMMEADADEQHATGKIIVVTGASKGLGKQVCLTLLEEGANIAMIARTQADLDAAREEIIAEVFGGVAQMEFQDPPRNVITLACDVTDQDAVDGAVDSVIAEFGGVIDVLVNCAGQGHSFEVKHTTSAEDFTDDFSTHMSANVQSFICPVKSVLEKAMVKAQDGQIISLSCAMGRDSVGIHSHADPMSFGFGYSKFALETLSHAYAHEYEDQRIRFNILVPGRVYSDGFPHRMGDLGHEYDTDHIRKGLLCMLDTDMNAEVVEAVAEAERGGDDDDA